MKMMLILCAKAQLASFVDELNDWREEGAKISLYGITNKVSDGFIFLEWGKPVPERFYQKLHKDQDVVDYLVFGYTSSTPIIPA